MASAVLDEKATRALVEYLCPVCLRRGKRNVIIKGKRGSEVEAYCWKCKFRKLVIL